MKLHFSAASPYVRKVRVMAIELGLDERIELVPRAMTPIAPEDELNAANPLGKIPCLVTDDGMALYDSRVIVDYLDMQHDGPKLIPEEPARRWPILRLQALSDGILDAAVGLRYETFLRPEEHRWDQWITAQKGKITRALDAAETRAGHYGDLICVGTIALGCALGYLDFRMPQEDWRGGRPDLAGWYAGFAQRPSMQATMPA